MKQYCKMFRSNARTLMTESFRIETGTFYYVVRYNHISKQYDILDSNNPVMFDGQ
jgi:hypothetical protein